MIRRLCIASTRPIRISLYVRQNRTKHSCTGVSLITTVENNPVLLYDGFCHVCSGVVPFVMARAHAGRVSYAPLQAPGIHQFLRAQRRTRVRSCHPTCEGVRRCRMARLWRRHTTCQSRWSWLNEGRKDLLRTGLTGRTGERDGNVSEE